MGSLRQPTLAQMRRSTGGFSTQRCRRNSELLSGGAATGKMNLLDPPGSCLRVQLRLQSRMNHLNNAAAWAEVLPLVPAASSKHFDFHFVDRDSCPSPSSMELAIVDHGIHGVRARHLGDLPAHYAMALEQAYDWLAGQLQRLEPLGNERNRVPVLLYAMDDNRQMPNARYPHVDQAPWAITNAAGQRA